MKKNIANEVGYVWYWDHDNPFFISHSYEPR